ncbi:hypothetical protein H2198_001489 [Neophaeococcomyces mojaviensis]|uniref:Uncharacterized protein n=1 Tax=Neophaeococcomyces mojaviensis TaxID=3383035 RepID=A0ACC3AH14_9EURO|nr:hypothetical protein H2198_001489 [Knufia sp. JES_112]
MVISPALLLVNFSAANVRLFFRIYFIILGTTIGPLGKACASARVKLKLLKGEDVGLTRMLGWLGGLDIITTTWKIRAFPSGFFLTFLMLVTYFISLASDLVGSYIRTVSVHDRCTFGTGLVVSSKAIMTNVPWNGYPYTVVSQAQVSSINNGGKPGIYAKVNEDATFSADDSDVLAGWQCVQNSLELTYSNQQSPSNIANDLLQHELLYSTLTGTSVYSSVDHGVIEHFVLVDTSNGGVLGQTWDARVCTSTSESGANNMTMLCYQCILNDKTGSMTDVLEGINSTWTIADWNQLIQGSCYDGTGTPVRPNLTSALERIFNSMVMISAGGNYLLDSTQSDSTQGCLTNRTWILLEVVALAIITALLNGFLVVYLFMLKIWQRSSERHEHRFPTTEARLYMTKGLKCIPGDLLGWTIQAIQESKTARTGAADVTTMEGKHLKTWAFGWSDQKNRFGVVEGVDRVEQVRLLVNNAR